MNYKKLSYIVDSQESASIKEATKLLMDKAGMDKDTADKWVRGDLRGAFPILRDKKAAKFILGTTRLFVDQELNDANAQTRLSHILKEVNENHYDEYDRNLNGDSLDALYKRFEDKFKEADKASRAASEGKQYGKSDYVVTGPFETFEEANKAWGDDSQDWCVFHMRNMFDSYTSAGQLFYVAAKNGWQDVPKEVGKDAPKDAYGNSLIAISVAMDGSLATSTPRWNHANGGGDHTYTVEELEALLQMPFYKTFKTDAEILTWGQDGIVKVIKQGGKTICKIGIAVIQETYFKKQFELKDGKIVPLFKDCIIVRVNDDYLADYNFLDSSGKLLLKKNAGDIDRACKSAYKVSIFNEGFYLASLEGKILAGPFDYLGTFDFVGDIDIWNLTDESNLRLIAKVAKDSKYNYIDNSGKLIFDKWFDKVGNYSNDFFTVELNSKENFVDIDGNLFSKDWFDFVWPFSKDGFALVEQNRKRNLLKKDGTLFSKVWYDRVSSRFRDGFVLLCEDDKYNFADANGKLLSKQWFASAQGFENGKARVRLEKNSNGEYPWATIDTKGNIELMDSAWKSAMKHLKKIG